MIKQSKNVSIPFGWPIYVSESTYNINETEMNFVKNLERKDNGGGGNNWMSKDSWLFKHDQMKGVKEFIQKNVEDYFYNLINVDDRLTEIYPTQAWTNYNRKGQSHHHHMHDNSILSAVFYYQTDKTRIEFWREDKLFPLSVNYKEWDFFNANMWWQETEPGKVIIFPSKLAHSVTENNSDVERISLAVNTFVKGHLGVDDNSTGLRL